MKLAMRARIVNADTPKQGLANITVELYDRDWQSADDFLGKGVTDAKGEIIFEFDEKAYQDDEDGPAWRVEALPDLYVKVYDARGAMVYSTRDVVERDKFPQLLIVPVPRALAEQLQRLPDGD